MSGVLKVIVNADDLGISAQVNAEIFRLIEARRVSSATLIANAPSIEDACARIRQYPQVSFGVHLNLTQFAPLTDDGRLSSLLDGNGHFDRDRVRTLPFDRDLKNGITAEWQAQIDRLRKLGVPISHIDSHEHVHTISALFGPLKSIQQWARIDAIRITKNVYTRSDRPGRALLLKKRLWNLALRNYRRTKTTQTFTNFMTMNAEVSSDRPPARTIELMVHPGNPEFAEETAALELEWWRQFDYELEMTDYRALD